MTVPVCIIVAFIIACGPSSAMAQVGRPSSDGLVDVHIDVIERYGTTRLLQQNFTAIFEGTAHPISLTSGVGTMPTHVLVVLQSQASTKVVDELKKITKRGWLLSVVSADGHQTPYSGVPIGLAAIGQGKPKGYNDEKAFHELESFAGRRVLIIEQSTQTTNSQTLSDARSAVPEIYRIDGGIKVPDFTMDADCGRATICADTPAASSQDEEKFRSKNGVLHEVDFKSAVKDALQNADKYYDVVIKSQPSLAPESIHLDYAHLLRGIQLLIGPPYLLETGTASGSMRQLLGQNP